MNSPYEKVGLWVCIHVIRAYTKVRVWIESGKKSIRLIDCRVNPLLGRLFLRFEGECLSSRVSLWG